MRLESYRYLVEAGKSAKISVTARSIRGVSSEGPYLLSLDDKAPTRFFTGMAFESPDEFERIELVNDQIYNQVIEVMVADGPTHDNRLVGKVDINGGIRQAGNREASYGSVDVADVATLVRPSNDERATVLLQNLGSTQVFVGVDTNVSALNGMLVEPGGAMEIATQTSIYAIVQNGTANVRWLEGVM